MSDLPERLRQAASEAEISAFHSDLMLWAGERIEKLENLLAEGVHSCHDQCQRPLCVLQRENERLRDGWIPVEERLPPDTPDCVIAYDGVSVCLADGDYVVDEIRYKDYLRTYTHWMPLPDPPEDK